MPTWDSVLKEIIQLQSANTASAFDKVRRRYLRKMKAHTGRNVIAYYSGFLTKPRQEGIDITDEDKNGFMLCVHGLDRTKGLDLILHTPGGDGQATISLVEYLRGIFGREIRAFVPQIAMSAGTMIASSCREIVMGRQSSLGPIDPQFGVIAAANLLAEVKKAKEEITANPMLAAFWGPILSKITPSYLERCEWAIRDSNDFLERTLGENMFADLPEAEKQSRIASVSAVFANNAGRAHNTHFQYQQCVDAGLNITRLEDDNTLQDLVLTVHHCYMHTLANTTAFKVIENHLGRATVRVLQQTVQLVQAPSVSLAPGGPS